MKNLLLFALTMQIFVFSACTKNISIEEKNKTVIRNWFEKVVNDRNLGIFDEFVAPEFVNEYGQNPDRFKKSLSKSLAAFPDLHFTIDIMLAEGDMVAIRWTWEGTHQGEYLGIAATGKRVKVTGMNISQLANGKYIKNYGNWDLHGLLKQLKEDTPLK